MPSSPLPCTVISTTSPTISYSSLFFFNDTATTQIYTLSLHDALPIFACANVANLVMVRDEGRGSEIAIRSELGCPRMRLVGQLFTESLLLALAGGALGFLLAGPLLRLLIGFAPADVPRIANVHLDLRVVLWTFAICLISGVLFGVLPAFLSTRVQIAESLKMGCRAATIG